MRQIYCSRVHAGPDRSHGWRRRFHDRLVGLQNPCLCYARYRWGLLGFLAIPSRKRGHQVVRNWRNCGLLVHLSSYRWLLRVVLLPDHQVFRTSSKGHFQMGPHHVPDFHVFHNYCQPLRMHFRRFKM
ncbi:hypothetical protein OESDEN_22983 [Oesophagostomum dentatum]|uniref:Uncharacterized protein n=1 Tax=Oesophagostomum dentatum TaxID=61180 RepID=A0A0B1S1M4_OESDE|nr:hypothetical protein OESDEN_22983 [Oesophagostomum dentatum]